MHTENNQHIPEAAYVPVVEPAVEKIQKDVIGVGKFLVVFGYLNLAITIGMFLVGFVSDVEILEMDFTSVGIGATVSVLSIILAKRLQRGNDIGMRWYMRVLMIMASLFGLIIYLSGGVVGALGIMAFVVIVISFIKIEKAYFNPAFKTTLRPYDDWLRGSNWVLYGIANVLLLLGVLILDGIFIYEPERIPTEDLVAATVLEAESQIRLPMQLSQGLIFEDIEAVGDTVVYSYVFTEGLIEILPPAQLQNSLAREVCNEPELSVLIENDVHFTSRYTNEAGEIVAEVTIAPEDCQVAKSRKE